MQTTNKLVETIVDGIQDKKGTGIVIVDLTKTEGAIANYFIVCEGTSTTQVEAIAGSVADKVREELHEKPTGVNGLGNNQWVAIDFTDVIVHIFQPEARAFYDLEHLWDDAPSTRVPDLD